MGIDRSGNLKPSEVKRFNTKDILQNFARLLNPELLNLENKDVPPELRNSVIALGNAIAQIGKDLQNPLPKSIETLKAHLGTPVKGSKGWEVMNQLTTFENNYLPNLTIQREELEKARELLRAQYQMLVATRIIDLASKFEPGLATLKAAVDKLREGKLQAFLDLKLTATETLNPLKALAEKHTGQRLAEPEHDESLAAVATAAAASTPKAAPAA